jgi:hypothetical protein
MRRQAAMLVTAPTTTAARSMQRKGPKRATKRTLLPPRRSEAICAHNHQLARHFRQQEQEQEQETRT